MENIYLYLYSFYFLPEGEDYEAGDNENCSKHGEDEVAGPPPACIVEHLGRL